METDQKNPFQSPVITSSIGVNQREPIVRFSFRAAGFSLVCGFAGAGIGALLGLLIGILIPNYYRSVVLTGESAHFDPVTFGLGQGATQGFGGGICVGLVIVALTWFFKYRSKQKPDD